MMRATAHILIACLLLARMLAAQSSREVRFTPTFENERVSVTRVEVPPGSFARVFQNTTHDVFWIALNNGQATFTRTSKETLPVFFQAGDVRLFHSFDVATVGNSGSTPLLATVVQLKARGLIGGACRCSGDSERAVCGCNGAAPLPALWALAAGQVT